MTNDYMIWNFVIIMVMMAIGGVVIIIKYESLKREQHNITKDIIQLQDNIDDLRQRDINLNAKITRFMFRNGFHLDGSVEAFIKWSEIDEAELD